MLNKQQTQISLEKFFKECEDFWRRTGIDEREAFESALDDTMRVSTDPLSPHGGKLDQEAKAEFIKYREQDLGK